tara:strand:- start:303 stop:698 length:396 start_codon:yes stop_codon:yes gene_type:complete
MPIPDSYHDFLTEIAKAADLCMKPWKHSVILDEDISQQQISEEDFSELIVRVECRDLNGERHSEKDIEIEIFRSGSELNFTLAWHKFPLRPILWQGKHSLWMDAETGKKSATPSEGEHFEALARRLRASFS